MQSSDEPQVPVLPDDDQQLADEPPPGQVVERTMRQTAEQLIVGMQSAGAPHDAFLNKLDDSHIHKVIDNSHTQEEHKLWVKAGLAVLLAIMVIALCWLFLAFEKSEHVDAIIALVIGALGGFGLGKSQSSE